MRLLKSIPREQSKVDVWEAPTYGGYDLVAWVADSLQNISPSAE